MSDDSKQGGAGKGQPLCGRNNKVCRNCKHRYAAGSQETECPECGEDRKCTSPRVRGKTTCRMHGSGGSKAREPKFLLGPNLSKRVNRILNHPELFELANEIAVNEARLEELAGASDKFNYLDWGSRMDKAIERANYSVKIGNRQQVLDVLDEINDLREEEIGNILTWAEMRETMKLHALLVKERHSMMIETQAMVSVTQLLEVITAVQRVIFKVVKDPVDRKYVIQEIRSFYADKP